MRSRREVLRSSRVLEIQRRHRFVSLRRFVWVLVLLGIIVGDLIVIAHSDLFLIDRISVSGNIVVRESEIKKAVEDEISGNYLFFFPKRNIFLAPYSRLRRNLLENFKRLAEADVKRIGLREIEITMRERASVYLWCGSAADFSSDSACYFMDRQGLIFAEAPYFSGNVYFRIYGSQEIFSPDNLARLTELRDLLANIKIKAHTLIANLNGDYEFLIEGPDPDLSSAKILFRLSDDPKKIFSDLQSALETEPLKTQYTQIRADLLYFDLRYPNKVFYKFK